MWIRPEWETLSHSRSLMTRRMPQVRILEPGSWVAAGCPDNRIVPFYVDSIGLGDSLPFTALNDPKGARGSHFEPGS
jgi:hypothetical protein